MRLFFCKKSYGKLNPGTTFALNSQNDKSDSDTQHEKR